MPGSSPDSTRPRRIGRTRQLFLDDGIVAATDLRRTFHKPVLHPASPVLVPETPLERNAGVMPAAALASVFHDREAGLLRMWYLAGYDDALCYATSTDGIEWHRPALDVVPGTNRVLPPLPGYVRNGATVWLDEHTTDPAERHKLFVFYRAGVGSWPRRRPDPAPAEEELAFACTSADGIHWHRRARAGPCGDNTSFFHDPLRGRWCFSIRTFGGLEGRKRSLVAHEDFVRGAQWTEADVQPWLATDALDAPDPILQWRPELYKVDAAAYEDLLIGLFGIYLGPPNHVAGGTGVPKTIDLHLGFSRDGVTWSRPDRSAFIACSRESGTWNRAYLQPSPGVCVVRGDELWFYFSAFSGESPAQGNGPYAGGSLGLAVLRRDGFASMDGPGVPMPPVDRHGSRTSESATERPRAGFLTTVPLLLPSGELHVNAAVRAGDLRVEVLDEQGAPISGFGYRDSVAISGDSPRHRVCWRDSSLGALQDRPVCLRFWLAAGELYSFWVEEPG
jgi:hypothetical protein